MSIDRQSTDEHVYADAVEIAGGRLIREHAIGPCAVHLEQRTIHRESVVVAHVGQHPATEVGDDAAVLDAGDQGGAQGRGHGGYPG